MTGILGAVSTALDGPFGWLVLTALAALAAMAVLGAITLAWLIRAAVRGWKRASEVIAEAQAMVAPPEVDPALARPIPEHVRQAIAEREGGQ